MFKYPDDEILQLYREAKDKHEEIQILAELNAVPVKEVEQFLLSKGIKLPKRQYNKRQSTKTKKSENAKTPEKSKQKSVKMPESIRWILIEKRASLIEQIFKMQKEVADIECFMGEELKNGEEH